MSKVPRVSVLMPAYNREAFIREAVESVLRQTYTDFEVVAVDDGSSDGTVAVLEELARRDGRVRVIKAGRLGLVGASNETVRHARGELLARLDADDVAMPSRLEKQVAYMDSHPECVVVGGQMEIMDSVGHFKRMKTVPTEHEQIDGFHMAGQGSAIMNSTAMMRGAAVREVGGYRHRFEICDDLDLWMRLAEKGRLANLPEVFVRYREHDANISRQREGWVRRRTHGAVRAAERRRKTGRINATEYAVRLAVRLGEMGKARGIAWWGVCRRPVNRTAWRMAAFAMFGPTVRAMRKCCGPKPKGVR